MCRFRVLARPRKLGLGSRKVCMSRVTFSERDEVVEYSPAEPAAAAHHAEPLTQTLTRKRGRPKRIQRNYHLWSTSHTSSCRRPSASCAATRPEVYSPARRARIIDPGSGRWPLGRRFVLHRGFRASVSGVQNCEKIASNNARMDAIRAEIAADEARERVLWLRGFI